MVPFLYGAAATAFAVIALYFLRFWKQSRDSLFLSFAIAFALLAVDRIILGLVPLANEFRVIVFLLRLFAFCLILVGIYAKNRSRLF